VSGPAGATYSVMTVVPAGARKFAVRWDPSQSGFFWEWPHRHIATSAFPSTNTKLGPFSIDCTTTFAMGTRFTEFGSGS
jgi:hypothetical protein